MILNIVSGGLNLKDKNTLVSQESYALAMTNLAFCILLTVMSLPKCFKMVMGKGSKVQGPQPKSMSKMYCLFSLCIIALNIAYSIMVFKYYNEKKQINDELYNFSMAVVIIDSFFTVYFMANYYGKLVL